MKAVENLDLHDRGFGPLYLDYQPSNQRNFHLVCSTLNKEYKVSREAIFYRLKDLNLITDARKETNNAYKLALNSIDI